MSTLWDIPSQQVQAQDLRRESFDSFLDKLTRCKRLLINFRNKPAAVLLRVEDWEELVRKVEFLEGELENRLLAEELTGRVKDYEADRSAVLTADEFWAAYGRLFDR